MYLTSEVGLRLLFSPISSHIVVRTACCTVGTVLPVYSTFKAIENNDQNEQKQWLLYWTVNQIVWDLIHPVAKTAKSFHPRPKTSRFRYTIRH